MKGCGCHRNTYAIGAFKLLILDVDWHSDDIFFKKLGSFPELGN